MRFRILKERLNSTSADAADKYVRTCIALHNFSIINGDLIYRQDIEIVFNDSNLTSECSCDRCTSDLENVESVQYRNARDKL